jgi:hypothetical protein
MHERAYVLEIQQRLKWKPQSIPPTLVGKKNVTPSLLMARWEATTEIEVRAQFRKPEKTREQKMSSRRLCK